MGDRANILVKENELDGGVFLYTHNNGTVLPTTLQNALKKNWRWDDVQYLTRIIFCEMVKGNVEGETGYGISSKVGDGDTRIITVTTVNQTVRINNTKAISFDDYIKLEDPKW